MAKNSSSLLKRKGSDNRTEIKIINKYYIDAIYNNQIENMTSSYLFIMPKCDNQYMNLKSAFY
jgi:hypothetical protein